MDILTLGITLAVVFVVLIIFRQLDRSNRSLEKIKKYADKLQDGMAAYADTRAEDLKRYGIEVEVKQQAAKEVLKRVKEVEDALNNRAGAIGEIEQRISEYDKALSTLMDMTARVDENLARLHDDYSFVEGAAKKLDAAKAGIDALGSELPAIRDEFRKQNDASIQAALEDARKTMRAGVETTRERYLELEKALHKAFERARTEAEKLEDAAFAKLKENTLAKAGKLQDVIEDKFKTLQEATKTKIAETQEMVKTFKADWKGDAEKLLGTAHAEIEALRERLAQRIEAVDGKVGEAERLYGDRFAKIDGDAEKAFATLRTRIQEQFKTTQADLVQKQADLKTLVQTATTDARGEQESLRAEMEKAMAGLAVMAQRFPKELDAAESKIAKGFDERIAQYRADQEHRFGELSDVQADIARFEEGLREVIRQSEERLNGEFALFGQGFSEREQAFAKSFEGEIARFKGGMAELEQGLNSLKSQAYANVSEKLKVFEDEFFADIKRRSESLARAMDSWKGETEKSLATLGDAAKADRDAVERGYSEELRARVAEINANALVQLGKVDEQVEAHAEALRERLQRSEESLASLKDSSDRDLKAAREAAADHIRAEIDKFAHSSSELVSSSRKDLDETLASLRSAVAAETTSVDAARADAETRLKALAAELDKATKETRAELGGRIAELETQANGTVGALKDDYEKQRDTLVEASRADRDRIARELETSSARIDQLRQEIVQRSTQALDQFTRSYETLLADVSKKTRDAMAEADSRVSEFKSTTEDFKGKVETTRIQIVSRVEGDVKQLSQSIADADKQIKGFVAQTKLFDKAEELKTSLSEAIAELKADIARTQAKRGEITELENQLGRVRRLEEEVSQKVARFQAEKRRFDTMEDDFKRLITIAQSVDQKLDQVKSSDDSLTEVQANIRKLLELSSQAEQKFDRLEKKNLILETTTTAVDQNFQSIQTLEKRSSKISDDMKDVPDRIIEMKRSLGSIEENKGRVDDAVKRIAEIETMLADAEKRAEALQKAREWLAKAETRFEDLNRQSESHLSMLKTLLKEEGVGNKKERGAPPTSAQEMVRKLARQGWKVEEIASATKLSRGEVELILELGAKA